MELQQMKYFKVVADTGKISEAARSLFISPPALSATISRLEKELGVRLFDRTNNRIILNKQGAILLRYVNQILGVLNNIQVELQQSMAQEREHIRVAVTFSNLWVGLICAFSLEHPQITLSYTTLKLSQLEDNNELSRYQFILAERGDMPPEQKMDAADLITNDRPVLVVHPDHPLAQKSVVTMDDLRGETLFLPVFDQSLHKVTCELLDDAGIPRNSAMECSYMVRRSMIMNNSGVSFATVFSSKYEEPSFRYIPIEFEGHSWKQKIFWSASRELSEQEMLFRDFAVSYFEKEKMA